MKLIVPVYVIVAVGFFLFLRFSESGNEYIASLAAAYILSLFHLTVGYVLIQIGHKKSNTGFLKTVLGGMAGRLFIMLAAFFVLIEKYELQTAVLVYAMLGLYVLNLTLETFFLQQEVSTKKP